MRSCEGEGAIVVSLLRLRTFAIASSRFAVASSHFRSFAVALSHFRLRNFALSHLRPTGESAKVEVAPSEHHRKALSRLRLSSHRLRIESGRYDKKCPINERKCIYCNSNDVEDEYHFVLVCDFYTELRKLYIKKYFYVRPSMAKFIDLLNSDSIFMLKKTG